MQAALDGAKGLRESWLLDFARRAQECYIAKDSLEAFMDKVWDSREMDDD